MSSCLAKSVHTSQLSLFSDLNFAVLPEVVAWLRVLIQYRADVRGEELRALDRLVRRDSRSVLLFQNQTGMRARIAATAYLDRMTCPRADRAALGALAAFRDRRRDFGQGF